MSTSLPRLVIVAVVYTNYLLEFHAVVSLFMTAIMINTTVVCFKGEVLCDVFRSSFVLKVVK